MSPKAGEGGVSANEYSCAHGDQINFGDPTPYFTYVPSSFSATYLLHVALQVFLLSVSHKNYCNFHVKASETYQEIVGITETFTSCSMNVLYVHQLMWRTN